MSVPTADELWTARREAIDATLSTITRVLTRECALMDDWLIQMLAVHTVDGDQMFRELADGRFYFE